MIGRRQESPNVTSIVEDDPGEDKDNGDDVGDPDEREI